VSTAAAAKPPAAKGDTATRLARPVGGLPATAATAAAAACSAPGLSAAAALSDAQDVPLLWPGNLLLLALPLLPARPAAAASGPGP
jgi:hypothetical protein